MKCPFKTTTIYTKRAKQYAGDHQGKTITVSCTAKDAHTVTHDFGECDVDECPFFIDNACSRCAGGKK